MARWQPFDVVGGAYSDDTRPWTVQDTVNYLVVNAERPGGRSNKMLRGVPGLVTFSASLPESSVRGLYVAEGRLFAVVGTTLYRIATDGTATSLGTIPGVGRCVFSHNQVSGGNQVVIGNGQSGYVFNTTDDTLTQITDEGFPGFRSVDFADQYIIGVEPFGRYWFHSDLADATSYSTLDRAEAEKAPDRIQQAIATGSDILVLGERTGQFFYNTGEATGTFQNRSGAEMDVGAASPWTACRLDNTVYWLGNDGSVYRLNGYVPQRISTHALEQAISRCTLSDAYAFTFEDRGHKCYLLTFPDGQTWCFDAATQEWTRRESYGFNRWRVSALVKWGRHWIAGDFINGRLYQLDWAVQQEAGEPLERRRITGVLHDDQNRMIVNALELVFDTGMDEDSAPLPAPILAQLNIAGDVPDGNIGVAASGSYTVSGGVLPYGSVSVTSGTFPPGLTLNADGTYSGAYTAQGSYSWAVGVTDADGNIASVADTSVVGASLYWSTTDRANTASEGITLTNANRDAERWGGPEVSHPPAVGVRGELKRSAGRYYFEIEVVRYGTGPYCGLARDDYSLNSTSSATGKADVGAGNGYRVNATSSAHSRSIGTGSVIGVGVDLDAGKVWFTLDGTELTNGLGASLSDWSDASGTFGQTLPAGEYAPWAGMAVGTSQDESSGPLVRLRLYSAELEYLNSAPGAYVLFSPWGGS